MEILAEIEAEYEALGLWDAYMLFEILLDIEADKLAEILLEIDAEIDTLFEALGDWEAEILFEIEADGL